MVNIFKIGTEFNNLAKAFNGMNIMLKDLVYRVESGEDKSELVEDIFILAYISKKGVFDRIETYKWTMDAKIIVPTIVNKRITLTYAIMNTIGILYQIAEKLNLSTEVQNIIDGGSLYQELDNNLPEGYKTNI